MSLLQDCAKKAISKNIKTEIKAGKSRRQATAIALSIADKNAAKCESKTWGSKY